MQRPRCLRMWLLGCALVCVVVSGCSTRKVKVQGQLAYAGKPLTGGDRQPLVVTFCPYYGEGKPDGPGCTATVDQATGAYEVVVPAGQARVCVSRFRDDLSDQFDGVFSPGQSPLIREIPDNTELNLDLAPLHRQTLSGGGNRPMPGITR